MATVPHNMATVIYTAVPQNILRTKTSRLVSHKNKKRQKKEENKNNNNNNYPKKIKNKNKKSIICTLVASRQAS